MALSENTVNKWWCKLRQVIPLSTQALRVREIVIDTFYVIFPFRKAFFAYVLVNDELFLAVPRYAWHTAKT